MLNISFSCIAKFLSIDFINEYNVTKFLEVYELVIAAATAITECFQ